MNSFVDAENVKHKLVKFVITCMILHVFNSLNANEVVILKKENKYEITVTFKTSTDICTTWSVITNYKDLPSFLPRMISSQVLQESGNKKVVRQVFKNKLLFFTVNINSKFLILENKTKKKIEVRQITGDLYDYQAEWKLTQIKKNTYITINAHITPTRIQALFFSRNKIRSQFKNMINSLKQKIDSTDRAHDCDR